MTSLSTWPTERVPEEQRGSLKEQELLKKTKERKLWKDMVARVLKEHGTRREREKDSVVEMYDATLPDLKKTRSFTIYRPVGTGGGWGASAPQ